MSFVSSTWQFVKRHKGKMVLLGGAIGGVVYLNRILSTVERNWETSASKDFITDVRRKDTHFENSMRTCNSTCSNLVPKIMEILDELLDAQPILDQLNQLKDSKTSPEKQIKLWKELSVVIFTRAASEVYCMCFFVCYLRVQLLVIAGYIYADSCRQESSCSINHNIQLKYVSLLNAFYDDGIRQILLPVKEAVRLALKNQSLKKPLMTADLQDIFDQVRVSMSLFLKGPEGNAGRILLKPERIASLSGKTDDEEQVTISAKEVKALETLMKETQDLLDTQDFSRTLNACIDVGFSHMLDLLVGCFVPDALCSSPPSSASSFSNPNAVQIPLVKVLPLMRQVLYNRTSVEDKQSLVRHLLCLDILNCYSANVYEAFCDSNNRTS